MNPYSPSQQAQDLTLVAAFLARRDAASLDPEALGGTVGAIVLLGSAVLQTVRAAVGAYRNGASNRILVSGGVGHSTEELWDAVRRDSELDAILVEGRSEAEILKDILVLRDGIPAEAVVVEDRSTNCGANAWESKRVLRERGMRAESLLLIQDPTMQRRTHASFARAWRGEAPVRLVSFAPFVPRTEPSGSEGWDVEPRAWPRARFLTLVLGEIPRLADAPGGYGPRGSDFIERVEVPEEVLAAHARLCADHGTDSRGLRV